MESYLTKNFKFVKESLNIEKDKLMLEYNKMFSLKKDNLPINIIYDKKFEKVLIQLLSIGASENINKNNEKEMKKFLIENISLIEKIIYKNFIEIFNISEKALEKIPSFIEKIKDNAYLLLRENEFKMELELKTDDQILYDILKENEQSEEDILEQKKEFDMLVDYFEKIDLTQLGMNPNIKRVLVCYGSSENGFRTKGSDIDCTLLTNSYVNERQLIKILEQFLRFLHADNEFKIEPLVQFGIRIPLLCLEKKFSFDVSINNILGIINTELFHTYAKLDERCKNLGKLIKIWAKKQGICNKNNLSSYGILNMVIFFLQIEGILPSLQKLSRKNKPIELNVKRITQRSEKHEFKTRVDFETDETKIKKFFKAINQDLTLNQLFLKFLEFYKENGQFLKNKKNIVDISVGEMDEKDGSDDGFLYSIKDPIDLMHNPGNKIKREESEKVKNVFKAFEQSIKEVKNRNFRKIFK